MRVLPDSLRDDQRRIWIDPAEDFDALALAGDESVLRLWVVRMRPLHPITFRFHSIGEGAFHCGLSWPADLIGGETQIAAGDKLDGRFRHGRSGFEFSKS